MTHHLYQHMTRLVAGLGVLAAGNSAFAQTQQIFNDDVGDATFRPSSTTAPLVSEPIDLVSLKLSGWQTSTPLTNPFSGSVTNWQTQHLFRMDLVIDGLVNPPGRADIGNYNPTEFGDNPLYAYIDLDIDDRKDTGGETSGPAAFRYLANVGRFGRRGHSSFGERTAVTHEDIDGDFVTAPYYERSGADWAFVLCGCTSISIVSGDTNANNVFDAGETWVIQGRLFERSKGYQEASTTNNPTFGGSALGLYDPIVKVQFSHSISADQTTVSLVYALDQTGAKNLNGLGSTPPMNTNVSDASSIAEGLQNIIDAANAGSLPYPVSYTFCDDWEGRNINDYMDPTDWAVTALVGTAFAAPDVKQFVWTDTGFNEVFADVNGDGIITPYDKLAIQNFVYAKDGTGFDADGSKNGRVTLANPGPEFVLYDLDSNGSVEPDDHWVYGHRADLDGSGTLTIFDYIAFGTYYGMNDQIADFTFDEILNVFDYIAFGNAYSQ
ncbi:MAG: hypothetical protein H6815_08130 [Phycisphaeraceae bacterium]|nr:hypothetical protein [Phycisphaerales bacterium]MCB9860408.1 hypothetical protein [Phycisphaeraceae bacterium]